MLDFLKRFLGNSARSDKKLQPESQYIVSVSDTGLECQRPDGKTERVTWDGLQAVVVETTEWGPFVPDVFWVLIGNAPEEGCVFPQGATGEQAAVERLQQLSGFDNEALIRAMGSTNNATFLCWKRS